MKTKSPLKNRLFREIKTSHIARKERIERMYQKFTSQLNSIISCENYRLITCEETLSFKYSLYHDCRSVLGFLNNSDNSKFLLSQSQFHLFLSALNETYNSECVLLCAECRDPLPSVLTNLENLFKHTDVFLTLLEDELLIVSEDLTHIMTINSEELRSSDRIEINIVGSRYLLKLKEILVS